MIRHVIALTVILLAAHTAKADLVQELAARKAIHAHKVAMDLGHAETITNLRADLLTKIAEPVVADESKMSLDSGLTELKIILKLRSNEICTGSITLFPIGNNYDRTYQVSLQCYDHKGAEVRKLSYNDRKVR